MRERDRERERERERGRETETEREKKETTIRKILLCITSIRKGLSRKSGRLL